jgi:hypothetical protein
MRNHYRDPCLVPAHTIHLPHDPQEHARSLTEVLQDVAQDDFDNGVVVPGPWHHFEVVFQIGLAKLIDVNEPRKLVSAAAKVEASSLMNPIVSENESWPYDLRCLS